MKELTQTAPITILASPVSGMRLKAIWHVSIWLKLLQVGPCSAIRSLFYNLVLVLQLGPWSAIGSMFYNLVLGIQWGPWSSIRSLFYNLVLGLQLGTWSAIGSLFYNWVLGLQFGPWFTIGFLVYNLVLGLQFGSRFTIWSLFCNWVFCSQVLIPCSAIGPCSALWLGSCFTIGYLFGIWVLELYLRITISYYALVFVFYLCQCNWISKLISGSRPVYLVSNHFTEIAMNSSVKMYSDIVVSLLEPRILVNILLWHNLCWFLTRSCWRQHFVQTSVNCYTLIGQTCTWGFDGDKWSILYWASSRVNLSSGGCEQHRRRPACASAQSDQRLCCSLFRKFHMLTCYGWNFIFSR